MSDESEELNPADAIWQGRDLLGRRDEADTIQNYLEQESATFLRQNRKQSLVLAIDAEYGQGKSWFLDRLAEQLGLTHPVARIDAWADDASEEPLTAFMASIDDALSPYLSTSSKLRDKLAAAKVAALPVMGRLVKGVMVKGLSKVAGDSAEDALGDAFEGAIQQARSEDEKDNKGDGAVASAIEGAFDEVGKEIDNLVDRRGAAMLAEYRQRKKSRAGFRKNMGDLVSMIDDADVDGTTPLVVIIDELDRCRPDYAIRVLEEIKHFFEVPGVVFVLAIHKAQLQASIEAVYGQAFDAQAYLLRFFTRSYELRRLSVGEIVETYFADWDDQPHFLVLDIRERLKNRTPSVPSYVTMLLDEFNVTAREATPLLDALRLFAMDTGKGELIQLHALMPLLVKMLRGIHLASDMLGFSDKMRIAGFSQVSQGTRAPVAVSLQNLLAALPQYTQQIESAAHQSFGQSAEHNLSVMIARDEFKRRTFRHDTPMPSIVLSYPDRIKGISRLTRDASPLEKIDGDAG